MVEHGGITRLFLGFFGLGFINGDGLGHGLAEIMSDANRLTVQLVTRAEFAVDLFRELVKTAHMIIFTAANDNEINGVSHRITESSG